MELSGLQLSDLSAYQRRLELVQQTADQVIKDLGAHGEEVRFSGNPDTAYQELTDQLIPILNYLMEKNHQRLFQLLYRIDLSEKVIRRELLYPGEGDASQRLAHLILERELKKVVIRNYFRQSGERDNSAQ
ncbi:MAG: hypothetical protein ACFB10_01965 [Salibacteraceae bacterium]